MDAVVLVESVLPLGEASIGGSWQRWPLLLKTVALLELVLLFEESIGVGWRWWLLLLDAVVLVEPVLLLERRASVVVDEGGR